MTGGTIGRYEGRVLRGNQGQRWDAPHLHKNGYFGPHAEATGAGSRAGGAAIAVLA
jgi:hypothetical protein